MVNLKIGKNDEGKTEYYLNELETYESFDLVISELQKLGLKLIDPLDGIYSRTAVFEADGKAFKIIFHEDVGVYAFSISETNEEAWLHQLLASVVQRLNDE